MSRRSGLALLAAAAVVLLCPAADAAYPGMNGKIAFIRNAHACNAGCDVGGDIWVMDADGGGEENITRTATPVLMGAPAWSPDGNKIAYRYVDPNDLDHLVVEIYDYVAHKDLGPVATIGTVSNGSWPYNPQGPTWKPDGTMLAIEGVFGIHTIDLAHGNFMTWLAAPTTTPSRRGRRSATRSPFSPPSRGASASSCRPEARCRSTPRRR